MGVWDWDGIIHTHTHIHSPPSLVAGNDGDISISLSIFGIIKNKGWEGEEKVLLMTADNQNIIKMYRKFYSYLMENQFFSHWIYTS